MLLLFGLLFGYFLFATQATVPAGLTIALVVITLFLTLFIGFIVAAVSGEMAGIVGSSNSPVSGIAIFSIVVISLIFSYIAHVNHAIMPAHATHYLIVLAIFATASVLAMACISNDNLQDLKTGHLVGATPWKQQIALVFGVVVGSLIIAPILNQLYHAYGFVGALPHAGMNPQLALAAPQATLMAALSKGIISSHMSWNMIYIGAAIGIFYFN